MALHIEERRNAHHQNGGGAAHSNRNSHYCTSQLYVTVGNLAVDKYRPTEAPLWERGTVLGNGLLRVTGLWREGRQWLYHVAIDNVRYIKRTVWEVYALLREARDRLRAQMKSGTGHSLATSPVPLALPAPTSNVFRFSPDAV